MSAPSPAPEPEAALAEIFRRLAERGRRVRMTTTATSDGAHVPTVTAGDTGQTDTRPEQAKAEETGADNG